MVELYKTLVRPIIEYNNVQWGPFYVSDNQIIERIQWKATRIIPSISHLLNHNRLRHLNLPSLQHHWRRGDLIYLYQILKGAHDIDNQLFIPSTVTTIRGHTRKLFKQHTNSYMRSKFFSNRVFNDWNLLPQFTVNSCSVNEFRKLLDRHYSKSLFDYV